MKKTLVYTILLTLLISCGTPKEHTNTVHFTRDDFKNRKELKGEKVEMKEILNADQFYLLNDTAVLVTKLRDNVSTNNYFFDVYSLNSGQKLFSFLKKGRGPREYVSANIKPLDQASFLIRDASRRVNAVWNIDSLLTLKENYNPRLIKTLFALSPTPIGKGMWAGGNVSYNPEDASSKQVLYWYDTLSVVKPPILEKGKSIFFNDVDQAMIQKGATSLHYVMMNTLYDRIEFRDTTGVEKVLVGPDGDITLETKNMVAGPMKRYMFKDPSAYQGYSLGCADSHSFYTIYYGLFPNSNRSAKECEVMELGWRGELKSLYHLNKSLNTCYVSKARNCIYGTVTDEETGVSELYCFPL